MSIHSYITSQPLKAQNKVIQQICRLLASPARLGIVTVLSRAENDMCVNEIAAAVKLSQSATSHQLALLEAHGVVEGMRDGQTTCYVMTDSDTTKKILKVLNALS